MSTKYRTECDFCGKEKGPNNHWWKVTVIPSSQQFQVWAWDTAGIAKDCCGAECVTLALSRYLSTGKLEQDEQKS